VEKEGGSAQKTPSCKLAMKTDKVIRKWFCVSVHGAAMDPR
jgi:hypothetical protein